MACTLFFQAVLLAGYAYGRAVIGRWPPRRQALGHLGLLAAAGVVPVSVSPHDGHIILAVASALALGVGAPFFALSTTVPVAQSWLMSSDSRDRENPYVLYAASNAGALFGLLSYPLLVESLLPLPDQIRLWRTLYLVYAVSHLACLPSPSRILEGTTSEGSHPPSPERAAAGWGRRELVWLSLSAAPGAAMLAATNFLTFSFAPLPLVWAIPLAIYLLTFILAFKRDPWEGGPLYRRLLALLALLILPVAAAAIGGFIFESELKLLAHAVVLCGLLLNAVALFATGMIGNASLARLRPALACDMPRYYLCVALGGFLGSAIITLAVPLAFPANALVGLDWLVAGILALGAMVLRDLDAWRRRRWALPAAIVLSLMAAPALIPLPERLGGPVAALRNYYGIYEVKDRGGFRRLFHGNTLHGVESTKLDQRGIPLAYYYAGSPISDVLRIFGPRAESIGVVGLGAGTLAAYARKDQRWLFYELDQDVEKLAREHFSFLRECRAEVAVVIGDGRRSLALRPEIRHDLLILDAFNSDAAPVHLMTREAFELYFNRLTPEGLIVMNVSNRMVDLRPVMASLARDLGVAAAVRHSKPARERHRDHYPSLWIAFSRDGKNIARLLEEGWLDLREATPFRVRAWTDAYASLLPLLVFQ